MGIPKKLYHGTCRAFVECAKLNKGRFGPSYDKVSFALNPEDAKMFSESWKTEAGLERLAEYFGEISGEFAEPVILEFDSSKLNKLKYRNGVVEEFYVERGPVDISGARKVR